jgi:hypothetical protein
MVTLAVPVVAELPALRVRVLPLVAGLGLKLAVTPLGKPEADSATLPLNPFCGITVMLLELLAPCVNVELLGDAESTNVGTTLAPGQLFTKLAALTDPMPVAKSQPIAAA